MRLFWLICQINWLVKRLSTRLWSSWKESITHVTRSILDNWLDIKDHFVYREDTFRVNIISYVYWGAWTVKLPACGRVFFMLGHPRYQYIPHPSTRYMDSSTAFETSCWCLVMKILGSLFVPLVQPIPRELQLLRRE